MGVGGTITLNADGKVVPPGVAPAGVATIIGRATDGTLTFDVSGLTPALTDPTDPTTSVAGNFLMGMNEKLTSVGQIGTPSDGNLDILGNGGTFFLSDLTVDGDLFVHGRTVDDGGRRGAVVFNVRTPGVIQRDFSNNHDGIWDTNDIRADQGLDIVVRDWLTFRAVTFETPTTFAGPGTDPQFALRDPNQFSMNLYNAGYTIRILEVFRGLQGPTGRILDHLAEMPSITNVAQGFAANLPPDNWWYEIPQDIAPTRPQVEELQTLGIFGRDYSDAELDGQLSGWNTYDDMPQSLEPQPQDFTVAVGRLEYEQVEDALKLHRQLSAQEAVHVDGVRTLVESFMDMGLTRREMIAATEAVIKSFNVEGVSAEELVDDVLTPPLVVIEEEAETETGDEGE